MRSVIAVADEILKIAKRKGVSLTPLQLMKLTYIANGWSLGIRKRPLFSDRIEAWKYGPVIPYLYHFTKRHGRSEIPLEQVELDRSMVEPEISAFLEEVFDKYGHLSGYQLSMLTHKDGSPWEQVYRPDEFGIEIPTSTIRSYYERELDRRNPAPAS